MPNLSREAVRALDAAVADASTALVDAVDRTLPDSDGRDVLRAMVTMPDGAREALAPDVNTYTLATRWHAAGMPRLVQVKRHLAVHRAAAACATGHALSLETIAVTLGMDRQNFIRHVLPITGPRVRTFFDTYGPADTLAQWTAFLAGAREACLSYSSAPAGRLVPTDRRALSYRAAALERELRRIRGYLAEAA